MNARKGRASAPLLHAMLLLRCRSAVALLQAGADPDERLLDVGDLALGEEYRDISARALHDLNRKAYTKLMGDQACWSAFENLLQKPRDARSTLASMWESLRGLY